MGAYGDRMMRFHRPRGMSCSHWRCIVKQRVRFANRRNCRCETGCQPQHNEGRICWLSEYEIPVGYFKSPRLGERDEQ